MYINSAYSTLKHFSSNTDYVKAILSNSQKKYKTWISRVKAQASAEHQLCQNKTLFTPSHAQVNTAVIPWPRITPHCVERNTGIRARNTEVQRNTSRCWNTQNKSFKHIALCHDSFTFYNVFLQCCRCQSSVVESRRVLSDVIGNGDALVLRLTDDCDERPVMKFAARQQTHVVWRRDDDSLRGETEARISAIITSAEIAAWLDRDHSLLCIAVII